MDKLKVFISKNLDNLVKKLIYNQNNLENTPMNNSKVIPVYLVLKHTNYISNIETPNVWTSAQVDS